MPVPAALRLKIPAARALILLMNRSIICLAAVFVASLGFAQDKPALKDVKDKQSYSIGHDIGTTFKKQNIDLNLDALMLGLKDAVAGKEAMTKEERDKTLEAFSKEMMEKQVAANKEAAAKNLADGEKFLAENKKKDGVKTTASGLQYKVLKEGSGASPKESDSVVTNYKGTLIDGTEFDSSAKHGGPATFPVNSVIKGWVEALQLMKPGGKFQIFVPANLAYGEQARSAEIGPNSTLIFELELVSIKSPDAKGEAIPTPPMPKTNAPPATPTPKPQAK
jgi:FKBP-type peptidyl-prolyl cis-trans isomerase FklB